MSLRQRKCRHCREPFTPERRGQVACGVDCAMAVAAEERQKQQRVQDRARAEEMKPMRQLMHEAQAVFNAYVRERDRGLPCISCGRFHEGQWHAGHYMSTEARPNLRFDEANVHRQCQPCNAHMSGNLAAYRLGLVHRIGADELARLEAPMRRRPWTREELLEIKTRYRAKRRELMKETA